MIQFQKRRGSGASAVSAITGRSRAISARKTPRPGSSQPSAMVFTRWAMTGATPSVPMATTSGSRSTSAGVIAEHRRGLSTTLTTPPRARMRAEIHASTPTQPEAQKVATARSTSASS